MQFRKRKSISSSHNANLDSPEKSDFISSAMLSKEKWVPDHLAKVCFSCNKTFIPLIRPRHHCRRCGNVFCKGCSQYFFFADQLQIQYPEKRIRVCDYCYQGYKNFLKFKNKEHETKDSLKYLKDKKECYLNDNSTELDDKINFYPEVNSHKDTIAIEGENAQENMNKILDKIDEICEILTKKCNIYDEWNELVRGLIKKAILEVHPNTINSSDCMNINNFIKIKKIPFIDQKMTRYLEGVVCRKNVSDKKMFTLKVNNPTILIATSIEISSGSDLETIDNENQNKKIMKKINEKIVKLKPNIILVEKSMNGFSYNYFKDIGIIIILKIKHSLIKRISRLTKAKIIKNIKDLENVSNGVNILGTCQKFYINKFFVENYSESEEFKDPNLMFLEGCDARLGVTLTISGPNENKLKKVKECMKEITMLSRDLILEKEIILNEENFTREIEKQITKKSEINNKSEGNLDNYLFEKIDLNTFINVKEITYTKANFVRAMLENYNDIYPNEDVVKYLNDTIDKKKTRSDGCSIGFFAELCGDASIRDISFYSEEDLSIGQYIILKVSNLNSKCEVCKRPRYQHIVVYYSKGTYVKISAELTGMKTQDTVLEDMFQSKQDNEISSTHKDSLQQQKDSLQTDNLRFFPRGKNSILKDSSPGLSPANILQKLESARSIGFQNAALSKTLKYKKSASDLFDIKSYLECGNCGEIITKVTTMTHNYLEYSFTRFLMHIFHTNNPPNLPQNNTQCKILECSHLNKIRYFSYNGILIKILCGNYKFYSLQYLRNLINSSENKQERQKILDNIILLRQEQLKIVLKSFSNEINNLIKAQFSYDISDIKSNDEKEYDAVIEMHELSENSENKPENLGADNRLSSKVSNEEYSEFCGMLITNSIKSPTVMTQSYLIDQDDNIESSEKNEDENEIYQSVSIEKSKSHSIKKTKTDGIPKIIVSKFKLLNNIIENLNSLKPNSYLDLDFIRFKFIRKAKEILEIIQNPKPKSNFSSVKTPLSEEDSPQIHENHEFNIETEGNSEEEEKKDLKESIFSPEKNKKNMKMPFSKCFLETFKQISKGLTLSDLLENSQNYSINKYKFVPINEDEPFTAVANSLNSTKYMREIFIKNDFHEFEKHSKSDNNLSVIETYLKKNLFDVEFTEKNSCYTYKTHILTSKKHFSSENKVVESISLDYEESANSFKKMKNSNLTAKVCVKVYFPASFEALRLAYGIPLVDFIQSLSLNNQWKENSGGKSKAQFIKSFDDLYILKQMSKNEFFMFQNYASEFFSYMWELIKEQKESLLAKIYGIFEIVIQNNTFYFIAMENLFYGLNGELEIYDLKGSEKNRFVKSLKKNQTLLDTNFKIDKNNEPIGLIKKDYDYFEKAIQNDSFFLSEHNLIDYSLLLIIDNKLGIVRMGIIDYLRIYTWDKQLEHMGKIVINAGTIPTITNPNDYGERFRLALKKAIMPVKG